MITVGINGFGRIGRVIFRSCLQKPNIQVLALNDPAVSAEYICYLIKFDSTHGKFCGTISNFGNEILVNGKSIKIFHHKLPSMIPWSSMGVDYVIEASGMFTSYEKASGHLSEDRIKRVIVTAPSVDVPMILLGINCDELHPDVKVLSCASSTLYCLAPIVKVLEDSYGVEEGFITSIHAMTPSLKPLDGLCLRGKHWRDHRSIHQNIIPATTGACKALGKIMPRVKDKLHGLAFRVPIVNVSVLDLTIRLIKPTSLQEIVKNVKKNKTLQNIIRISYDETVSSDFIGETHSCILDANSSLQLTPNFFKLICWYENEYSYACRVVDTLFFCDGQLSNGNILNSLRGIMSNPIKKEFDNYKETLKLNNYENKDLKIMVSKYKSASVNLNKPSSTLKDDTITSSKTDHKRRYENFKILNEDNQAFSNLITQKRNSFFQSCLSCTPQKTIKTSSLKVQERLDRVKQDFSNIINISNNLLKKSSYSKNKNNVQSSSKSSLYHVAEDGENVSSPLNPGNSIKSHNIPLVSGDFHTLDSHVVQNGNESNIVIPITDKKKSNKNYTQDRKNSQDTPLKLNGLEKEIFKTSDYLKRQVAKSFNSFLNEIQPNLKFPHPWTELNKDKNLYKSKAEEKTTQHDMQPNDEDFKMCIDENHVGSTSENHNQTHLNVKSNPILLSKVPNYFENTLTKIGLLSEQLRKRNIVLVTSHNDPSADYSKTEPNKKTLQDEELETINSDGLNNINKQPTDVSEDRSKCFSPSYTNTTISIGDRRRTKQDIYDKLDSASASDSENSFQIHERKSQIINIQDLSSSLDDLVRLDKICRIIEISDDLSNELFSTLDRTKESLHESKWSFKDLCDRINLDDFCDRIFGKSII